MSSTPKKPETKPAGKDDNKGGHGHGGGCGCPNH